MMISIVHHHQTCYFVVIFSIITDANNALKLLSKRSTIAQSPVDGCLLRCKDKHMFDYSQIDETIDSSEWSTDFLNPILALLKNTNDLEAVNRYININCRLNRNFSDCLQTCSSSNARQIVENGLLPWQHMCDEKLSTLKSVLPCWRVNADKLIDMCKSETEQTSDALMTLVASISNANSMKHVCSSLRYYRDCTVFAYDQLCGIISAQLMANISQIASESLQLMIRQFNHHQESMPIECEQLIIDKKTIIDDMNRDIQNNTAVTSQDFCTNMIIFLTQLLFSYMKWWNR